METLGSWEQSLEEDLAELGMEEAALRLEEEVASEARVHVGGSGKFWQPFGRMKIVAEDLENFRETTLPHIANN